MSIHSTMTGAELQTLREACGLSREEFAELARVQARTIKHWESGRAGVPADVAAQVTQLDDLITRQSKRLIHDLQHTSHAGKTRAALVLLRYKTSRDMPTDTLLRLGGFLHSDRLHGAMIGRVWLTLSQAPDPTRGPVRVAWFEPAPFAAWCAAQNLSDSDATRSQWAAQALTQQAGLAHRADQPPA